MRPGNGSSAGRGAAQMDQLIADMTDAAKKKEAIEALDQSKAAMKAGNTAQCMKYMDEAHKVMGL
jgi:hypothetical protein